MFRQEIAKVDTMLARHTHTKYFSNPRASLARKTALSHKADFAQKSLNVTPPLLSTFSWTTVTMRNLFPDYWKNEDDGYAAKAEAER